VPDNAPRSLPTSGRFASVGGVRRYDAGPGVIALPCGYAAIESHEHGLPSGVDGHRASDAPKSTTSKWTALTFLLGPRRITRHMAKIAATLADELGPPFRGRSSHRAT
jgi:hypothetical protein